MAIIRSLVLGVGVLALAGCANLTPSQQRMLSGGALGSAAGLGIAALSGGSLLVGGLVGAAGGAAVGALAH
ncbi:MAG: hypothetical protein M0Z28_11215 [Rhodospirillales bacterium]|nr:hypothetical protein [Rhodospirillales bacterium]